MDCREKRTVQTMGFYTVATVYIESGQCLFIDWRKQLFAATAAAAFPLPFPSFV